MRGNMSPIQHVLVNLFGKGLARIVCFLAVSFASLAFGAGELTADSVLASFDSVGTVDASVNGVGRGIGIEREYFGRTSCGGQQHDGLLQLAHRLYQSPNQ